MPAPRLQRFSLTSFATVGVGLALTTVAIGFPVAIASFNRANSVPYSCLNHVISELGFPFASPLAWVFNSSITLLGVLVLPALYAVQRSLGSRSAHAALFVGSAAFLALSLMGLFGLQQDLLRTPYILVHFFFIHIALAGVFFLGWFIAASLYAIAFFRGGKHAIMRLMIFMTLLCCVVFSMAFLVLLFAHTTEVALVADANNPALHDRLLTATTAPQLSPLIDNHRPHIWPQAVLEWCMAFSVILWFASTIVFLWSDESRHAGFITTS